MRTLTTLIQSFVVAAFALLASASFAAVDANQANQAELEAVKSIGPAIAGRILDERKKAAFKDWGDMIDRVKGVGAGNAAKFSAQGLTVNGSGFDGAVAAPVAPTATPKKNAGEAKPPAQKKP